MSNTFVTLEEIRAKIQQRVGQLILALANLPRYKQLTLAEVQESLIHPLLRNRIIVSQSQTVENLGQQISEEETVTGIVIWASVSPEVDAKITAQADAGIFPVRLAPEEWTSGDQPWLLDVIAENRYQAAAVLANLRTLTGEKMVRIHPLVSRLIDPSALQMLKPTTSG